MPNCELENTMGRTEESSGVSPYQIGKGTAAEKVAALKAAGIHVVESPAEMGAAMKQALTI